MCECLLISAERVSGKCFYTHYSSMVRMNRLYTFDVQYFDFLPFFAVKFIFKGSTFNKSLDKVP